MRLYLGALVLAVLLATAGIAEVRLVSAGTANAVIIIADNPTPTTKYAAEELVTHVERATGAVLKVLHESAVQPELNTRIYVGDTQLGREYGIDVEHLPREAFLMRSVGNDLFIAGPDAGGPPLAQDHADGGTLFGVYEFIERFLGVRWLWPGELGTYVPKTQTVALSSVNEMAVPTLAFRRFYLYFIHQIMDGGTIGEEDARLGFSPEVASKYAKALEVLLRRHRLGGLDAVPPTAHFFSGWWQRYGKEHPAWFAMRKDGTRGHPDPNYGQVPICVSNEELQDFIVSQWDGKSVLLLGPIDRPGCCLCERCQAWDSPQPKTPPWFATYVYGADPRTEDFFGGFTSDRYARFWKVILEKARKRNPQAQVSISFIYHNQFPAPTHEIRLDKAIYGEFVPWQDPYLRYFPMPEDAVKWIESQWIGWQKTGIRMGYRPNYLHDGYVMPHFETRQEGEFFKFAYAHGMEGAQFDSLTGQWATQGPRLYMHLRLLEKPGMELDAIRKEYLSAFGPAADAIDRYFQYWEDFATKNTIPFVELYRDVGRRYANYVKKAHIAFPPESFQPAEALLEEAFSRTRGLQDSSFYERVRYIQIGLQHAQLASRLAAAFDGEEVLPAASTDEGMAALKSLVAFRKENEHTFFADLYHATAFWERPRMNLDELIQRLPAD